MAALPYMQMYWGDYFADTPHLSAEEHGAYLLLIGVYWQRGKSIPVDQLSSITKLNERWTDVESKLNPFFTVDEQGNWYHQRIEDELAKVKSKSVKASAAGKASAAKRAKKQPQPNERSTDVDPELQPQPNHTETEAYTEAYIDTDNNSKTDVVDNKIAAVDYLTRYAILTNQDELTIRRQRKNIDQAKQWYNDEVTMDDLSAAIDTSIKTLKDKGENRMPPLAYVATVLAGQRAKGKVTPAGKPKETHRQRAEKFAADFNRRNQKPIRVIGESKK